MVTENNYKNAIEWAKKQIYTDKEIDIPVFNNGNINKHFLVHFVRKYFNENNIDYNNFSFNDLKPYL